MSPWDRRTGVENASFGIGQSYLHVPSPNHCVVELVRECGVVHPSCLADKMSHLELLLPQRVHLPFFEAQRSGHVDPQAGQGKPCQR